MNVTFLHRRLDQDVEPALGNIWHIAPIVGREKKRYQATRFRELSEPSHILGSHLILRSFPATFVARRLDRQCCLHHHGNKTEISLHVGQAEFGCSVGSWRYLPICHIHMSPFRTIRDFREVTFGSLCLDSLLGWGGVDWLIYSNVVYQKDGVQQVGLRFGSSNQQGQLTTSIRLTGSAIVSAQVPGQ